MTDTTIDLENLKATLKKLDDVDYFQLKVEDPPEISKEPTEEVGLDEPLLTTAPVMNLAQVQAMCESLLFVADKPLSLKQLHAAIGDHTPADLVNEALNKLIHQFQMPYHGVELVEIGNGYQFRTKIVMSQVLKRLTKVQVQKLSTGALEALAIVAYHQPVVKDDIDKIRGVDSSYFIRNLLEKKLIQISGRSELPGKPMLYTTTTTFLEFFGLKGLSSLPALEEIEKMVPSSESDSPESQKSDPFKGALQEMVQDSTLIEYNEQEDEETLLVISQNIRSIPVTTPFLETLNQKQKQTSSEESL
jgi:segregation and condensation protein B